MVYNRLGVLDTLPGDTGIRILIHRPKPKPQPKPIPGDTQAMSFPSSADGVLKVLKAAKLLRLMRIGRMAERIQEALSSQPSLHKPETLP